MSAEHSELRELAESALRRPVARHTGVRISTVEAKALAHGVCDLIEQLQAAEEQERLAKEVIEGMKEQLQASLHEGYSAEHWHREYVEACKSLKKRVHQGAEAVRRERGLREQLEAKDRAISQLEGSWRECSDHRERILEQYEGWVKLSHQLFNMIPREVWRDQGGDDGQGHYEGEYHAERIEQEIHAALASFPASRPHPCEPGQHVWRLTMGGGEYACVKCGAFSEDEQSPASSRDSGGDS